MRCVTRHVRTVCGCTVSAVTACSPPLSLVLATHCTYNECRPYLQSLLRESEVTNASLSIMTIVDIVGEVIGNPGDVLTDYQLWAIHQKCQILFCVLNIAREKMPIVQNWDRIFLEGLEAAKRVVFLNHKGFTNCEKLLSRFQIKKETSS